jgi:hypothetical protein
LERVDQRREVVALVEDWNHYGELRHSVAAWHRAASRYSNAPRIRFAQICHTQPRRVTIRNSSRTAPA